MMSKLKQFGENVDGYNIPVLNEREIRAAAGILFLFTFLSLMLIILNGNFSMIKYVISGFMMDFAIRVLISPRYAPTLVIGRLIVSRQNPEYVGAAQKKVAWIIGLGLSLIMFGLMVILNSYSIITGLICFICLIFLFFESSFGICLGCLFYKWIKKEKAQYCPGEVCEIKNRHDIQKTSFNQILIVVLFGAIMVAMAYLFQDDFSKSPQDLWILLDNAF